MDVKPTKGDQWDVPGYLWLKQSFSRVIQKWTESFKLIKKLNLQDKKNIEKQIKTNSLFK